MLRCAGASAMRQLACRIPVSPLSCAVSSIASPLASAAVAASASGASAWTHQCRFQSTTAGTGRTRRRKHAASEAAMKKLEPDVMPAPHPIVAEAAPEAPSSPKRKRVSKSSAIQPPVPQVPEAGSEAAVALSKAATAADAAAILGALSESQLSHQQQQPEESTMVKKRPERARKTAAQKEEATSEHSNTNIDDNTGVATTAAAAAVTASVKSNESELDFSSGDAFFASLNMLESAPGQKPRGIQESTLIYNPLNGRMTSESSYSVTCLRTIGFGVNPQRQLYLENPEAFNALAHRVRSGATSLSERWPVTVTRTLNAVLGNTNIADPAEAIQQMMRIKLNSIMRSRYASVVNAADNNDPNKAEVSSSSVSFMDELSDPSKSIELNEEQERVIQMALRGHHMYIGGSAGTGKTVLLRVLSRRLQAHRLRVAMTATTGVAGCHIGGSTFHHAIGVSSRGEFLRRSTILDYDVIIIDEVSMFPLRLFEDFDRVLREEAGTPDLPFGGVQIILCGDFLQLGCINEDSVIGSALFQKNFVKLRLETQVRQSAYPKFAADLQKMRLGIVPSDLTKTVQQLPPGTMVESAVNLLPTNKEVHAANEKEMERLEGEPLTLVPETGITALTCETTATLLLRTSADFNEGEFSRHVRSLLQATLDLPRSSLLSLYKIYEDGHAMRVMLPPGESVAWREAMRERFLEVASLINDLNLGAVVTEIVPSGDGLHTPESEEYLQKLMTKHPIAQPLTFKKGCRVLLRANLSSNLVNGSIGTVVDFAECKPESFPDYLRNENVDSCIERYRVFCFTECGMPIPFVPVVKFHTGETIAVPPWEFVVGGNANTHYYSLSSVALPLSLAYAFTVHKVQGLTLVGRVHLELSRMWPCEHLLYVAMSRVRNPEQLSMSSFAPGMVVADESCVRFDKNLKEAHVITNEELMTYPVSSWKRCNDTIFHLRRRGSSLRRLLEDATLNGGSSSNGIARRASQMQPLLGSSLENQQQTVVTEQGQEALASAAIKNDHSLGSPLSGVAGGLDLGVQHLVGIEQSVLVARRMRKLVKHVERVAKLSEARQKAKAKVATAAVVAVTGTSGGSGGTAAEAAVVLKVAGDDDIVLSEEHSF